ncbi:MAG: hypothetical protein NZ889_01240 [Candidatus Pacearchaeota archaeon]|nr:hypothetical protein [Candidatus Pacearchaeota archaeon]
MPVKELKEIFEECNKKGYPPFLAVIAYLNIAPTCKKARKEFFPKKEELKESLEKVINSYMNRIEQVKKYKENEVCIL